MPYPSPGRKNLVLETCWEPWAGEDVARPYASDHLLTLCIELHQEEITFLKSREGN